MSKNKCMYFDYDRWGWFDKNNKDKRLSVENLGKWFPFQGGKTRYLNSGHAEVIFDKNPQTVIQSRESIPIGYCPTHGKRAGLGQYEVTVLDCHPPITILKCPMCNWKYHEQMKRRPPPINDNYL